MAVIYPTMENVQRLKVEPTDGEWHLLKFLKDNLDDSYEVFFNPYLDGDRPDIVILKKDVSAYIIEIKDWSLGSYRVGIDDAWKVIDNRGAHGVASPHSQVFRYKKNLYDLHLPVIGLARLTNKNFFNLVQCFVYFHGSEKSDIDSLYSPAEEDIKLRQKENNENFKNEKINFENYEKLDEFLVRKKRNIIRDKGISVGNDRLKNLVNKIKNRSSHVLFEERVYDDFKRRLSPPDHTLKQGLKIGFDKKQLPLTVSKPGKEKIKGVAGCGKTTIMAQRALNAFERHETAVLILTFNITLKNYIKDKISDIKGDRDFSFIEISNYHQFFNSQLNNTGQDVSYLIERFGFDRMYSEDVFIDNDTIKYHTILLDEIQDYKPEWVKIIRDRFLSENGEMVLFGDESQDIYQRQVGRAPVIAQGFGSWIKLRRSYRTDFSSPLNKIFSDFQVEFLISKYSDTEISESGAAQIGLSYGILEYHPISTAGWYEEVFQSIKGYMSKYNLHPNDVVVLCSKIDIIRGLNDYWEKHEKTHCMFENFNELETVTNTNINELRALDESSINNLIEKNKDKVEKIRRVKKNHFYANSGLIKLSTIYSFKGLESKTVFYIMLKDDESEMVYTSITRSSENLVIYDIGNKSLCSPFFEKNML